MKHMDVTIIPALQNNCGNKRLPYIKGAFTTLKRFLHDADGVKI
jgi:hypothetical protein